MIPALSLVPTALVLLNLRGVPLTDPATEPTAITIVDGKFAYVGRDARAAKQAGGSDATVIDLGGRTVVPGFNDAHAHLGMQATLGSASAIDLGDLELGPWKTAITDAAARVPGPWVFVRSRHVPTGFTARDLDSVGKAVFVASQHGGYMNALGRKLGKFTDDEAPDGFVRGRLLAPALERIARLLPTAQLDAEAAQFFGELAQDGITSVQMIDDLPELVEAMRARGTLTARVRMIPLGFRFETRFFRPHVTAVEPLWFRVDGVKYFHDDGARLPRYELAELMQLSLRDGNQLVVHVLSAHALDSLLDFVEPLIVRMPQLARLVRIEHVDEVSARAPERLARLGITVCQNPAMLPEWNAHDSAFPMRTLRDAGVHLCIGSDWVGQHSPERPITPFFAIAHAVDRRHEAITLVDALTAFTVGSAAAEGEDDHKGRIAVGQLGDVAVLSEDPFAVPDHELARVHAVMTVVGGRVVYRAPGVGGTAPSIGNPRPASIGPARATSPSIGPAPSPKRDVPNK